MRTAERPWQLNSYCIVPVEIIKDIAVATGTGECVFFSIKRLQEHPLANCKFAPIAAAAGGNCYAIIDFQLLAVFNCVLFHSYQ